MQVTLTPKLDAFVRAKLEAGAYSDASEVVREALRLMQEHEAARRQRLTDMIDEGERQIEDGEFADYRPDQIEQMLTDAGW